MKKLIILSPNEEEIITRIARKITTRGTDNVSKAIRYVIQEYYKDHRSEYE
jgi:hypothetical protein